MGTRILFIRITHFLKCDEDTSLIRLHTLHVNDEAFVDKVTKVKLF